MRGGLTLLPKGFEKCLHLRIIPEWITLEPTAGKPPCRAAEGPQRPTTFLPHFGSPIKRNTHVWCQARKAIHCFSSTQTWQFLRRADLEGAISGDGRHW